MKKYCITIFAMGVLFISPSGFSQETVPLTLEVPAQFFMSACTDRPFEGMKVFWQGVVDQRPAKILGVVSKKEGKNPVQVIAEPPLEKTFESYLTSLLTDCGMTLVKNPQEASYQLQATIMEFHAEEEKGLLTGKGQAKSRLELNSSSTSGLKKMNAKVGYAVDFKQSRKRGIERLREILNELLRETLRQVPAQGQLRAMKS